MQYSYNLHALKVVREQFGFSYNKMVSKLDVPLTTYKSWEGGCVMSLEKLLHICNTLHIGIFTFISIDGKCDAEHVKIYKHDEKKKFIPTLFDHESMANFLTKELDLNIAEVCAKAKIGTPSYYKYFPKTKNKQSIIQIDKFLRLCNTFHVWPGSFLTEMGRQIPGIQGYTETYVIDVRNIENKRKSHAQKAAIDDMVNRIVLDNSVKSIVEELRKQYETLISVKVNEATDKLEHTILSMKQRIDALTVMLTEKDAVIEDLRTQLREARFYKEHHTHLPFMYNADEHDVAKVAEDSDNNIT